MVWTLGGRAPSVCQDWPASALSRAWGGLWPPITTQRLDSMQATASMPEPSGSGVVGAHVGCAVTRAPMAQGASDACPATRHEAPAQEADVNEALAGALERTGCHVAPLSREIASTALVGLGSKELPAATHSAGAPQPMVLRFPPRNGLGWPTPGALSGSVVDALCAVVPDEQLAATSASTARPPHMAWRGLGRRCGRTLSAYEQRGAPGGISTSTLGPVDWVDIVLGVLVVAAAIHGLRLGAVIQLSSFLGFFVGLGLGVILALAVAKPLTAGTTRTVITIALVLGLAAIFGTAGRVAGSWAAVAMRRWHLGSLDAAFGAAIGALSVLISAWLIAGFLVQPQFGPVASSLQRSELLRTLDAAMPPVPSALAEVQGLLSSQGFPSVFADLVPPVAEPSLKPTTAEAATLGSPVVPSVYKVFGSACGSYQEGTGFVVAPGVIVTNAHVVAGESVPTVIVGGRSVDATPVLVDPKLDIAVLKVPVALGPPLTLDTTLAPRGTQAAVVGFPLNGPLHISAAAISAAFDAIGRDIYGSALVTRQVYELSAQIEPGNSGSPLVGPGSSVLGVVFSRSTIAKGVGYALTAGAVAPTIAEGVSRNRPVSTGACAEG